MGADGVGQKVVLCLLEGVVRLAGVQLSGKLPFPPMVRRQQQKQPLRKRIVFKQAVEIGARYVSADAAAAFSADRPAPP